MIGERSSPKFQSTWTGVVRGAPNARWRVVGWTSETPNYVPFRDTALVQYFPIAQFNSTHSGGVTMFAFADGAVKPIPKTIDSNVFFAMGTINERDN